MKYLVCFVVGCVFSVTASSQNIHLTTFIGTANYYGDLQSKRFSFNQSRPAFGLGVSYEVNDKFFIKAGATIANVGADDKKNPQTTARNLNFTSSLTEGHLAGDFYILNPYDYSVSPYIFAGVAVYHFNPYTFDSSGTKYFLQPLSTEGQDFFENRKAYRLTQFAIPFGAGLKLSLSENVRVGVEVGFRKLFTDYLDDVSLTYADPNILLANKGTKTVELAYRGGELKTGTNIYPAGDNRGGAKYKDWYYFTGFTTSFRLGNGRHSKSTGKLGCPKKIN